jgi:hypothetical protein
MNLLVVGLIGSALVGSGAQASPVHVRASAEPARAGVGDPIRYVVEARFDAGQVDPSSVRMVADTGPFAPIAPTTSTRSREGSTVVVTLEQEIACLDLACAPGRGARRVSLSAPRVTARLAGRGVTIARPAPVTVAIEPRVTSADVRAAPAPFRQETGLPPTSGSGRPPGLLTALAVALAVLALVLALLAFRPRTGARPRGEDAFARAVRLLRESAARSVPDRRRAAGLVSRVAGSVGDDPLSDDAARIAWSAGPPQPDTASALADRAEAAPR